MDYLVAATAQETGAAVLHYDHDYDTLAEIMGFESLWLAPPDRCRDTYALVAKKPSHILSR